MIMGYQLIENAVEYLILSLGTSYIDNRRTVSYFIVSSVLTSGRENSQSSLLPKSVLFVFA